MADQPPSRRYKSPADLTRDPPTPTQQHARITATSHTHTAPRPARTRTTPYLPTRSERALLALYPALLAFGALYAALAPETRAAPFDRAAGTHAQDAALAPSYFARKDNLLNVLFVKRGWAWVTAAFAWFVLSHPALRRDAAARARAAARWALVTAWWVFVTQWFFGPAFVDRGFRLSGGKCEVARAAVGEGVADVGDVLTAAACKALGGSWRGGHDISGHVFLLVLGSVFLVQEVGWVVARGLRGWREERCVVMPDGAVKGADVEAPREHRDGAVAATVLEALGRGGMLAAAVVGLCGWMLLMTAIYFHTWLEKLTGLVVALAGLYITYILPRAVPGLRRVIGLPGI